MYAVSSRPSKYITTKPRIVITQKVDTLESSTNFNRGGETIRPDYLSVTAGMSSPKPTFHQVKCQQSQKIQPEVVYTPEHLEIVSYIQGMWSSICNEYESSKRTSEVPKVIYYQDSNSSNQHLQNFQPFDLESFWGERFLQRLKQDT